MRFERLPGEARPYSVPAMTSVGQLILILLGLVLLVCGILLGALGVWAMKVHSPGAESLRPRRHPAAPVYFHQSRSHQLAVSNDVDQFSATPIRLRMSMKSTPVSSR